MAPEELNQRAGFDGRHAALPQDLRAANTFSTFDEPFTGLDQRGAKWPAPAIAGGPWINSPPLASAALRGRVVSHS